MQERFKVHASKYGKDNLDSWETRVFVCKSEEEAKRRCDSFIAEGYRSYVTKMASDGWETGINYPPVPR